MSATFCERVALLHGRQGKVGDYVLQLGPDSAAPGARVVYEAKANKRYTIPNALKELAEARKNRAAQVGVRVFDRSSAPKDMEPLRRFGNDVLVAWDPEEPSSDILLHGCAQPRGLARRQLCVALTSIVTHPPYGFPCTAAVDASALLGEAPRLPHPRRARAWQKAPRSRV